MQQSLRSLGVTTKKHTPLNLRLIPGTVHLSHFLFVLVRSIENIGESFSVTLIIKGIAVTQ